MDPGIPAAEIGGEDGAGGSVSDVPVGRVPWEDPEMGFPANLFRTWLRSLAGPSALFRGIDPREPLLRPVLYFLLVSVAGALFSTLWALADVAAGPSPELAGLAAMAGAEPRAVLLAGFFLSPFYGLLMLGVATLLVGLGAALFVRGGRPLPVTTRVLCYASGPAVFALVPWVGELAALIGSFVLLVIGLREAHGTTTGRALAAAATPLFVGFLLAVFGGILLALATAGSLGDLPLS